MKNLTQKFQQSITRRIGKASIRSNSGLHSYISLSPPSNPAELFSNDHIQKGGKPLHREEDLKYITCRHLAFSSFSGDDNYTTSETPAQVLAQPRRVVVVNKSRKTNDNSHLPNQLPTPENTQLRSSGCC